MAFLVCDARRAQRAEARGRERAWRKLIMRRYLWSLLLFAVTPAVAAEFEYSAKFVCGKASGEVVKSFATAPGTYYTTISVANLHRETRVKGSKRFAMSLPSQKPGRNTKFVEWSLDPGTVVQVDCSEIYKMLEVEPGKFIEGFVQILGDPIQFDVAAVYTLFDGNYPAAIDIEHLHPR